MQQSGVRLGNCDVVPGGDITLWYLVATLQSWPQERQMYVTVLDPGGSPASLARVIFICYWA